MNAQATATTKVVSPNKPARLDSKPPAVSPAPVQEGGLSTEEAQRRLIEFGPNELSREKQRSPWRLLFGQFNSSVVWLLLGACLLSALLGEVVDASAIGGIVVINALVGFFQEYRAERALLALRAMSAPRARAIRDGRAMLIAAREVAPGDMLLLEAGDIVAADAKLIEANSLQTNEAALTGESLPAEKSSAGVPDNAPLAERHCFVFMGTSVANGAGRAVVTATGMRTELGKIAHLLSTAQDEATPLQQRLTRVSRVLMVLSLCVVAAVAALGLLRGAPWLSVFLSAVSLAVAAVPEGLPAVVTVALAVGVQRMARRNVLVRRLPAVETLGSTTVICTDKTGTLTTGLMRVREIWGQDKRRVIEAAAACCDAELNAERTGGVGDPTEIALLLAAAEQGFLREDIEQRLVRVRTAPFDAVRKRMSVQRSDGMLYVKGALEMILPLCSSGANGGSENNALMAAKGLRVLAVAVGSGEREEDLRLLGLVGIADPPRDEAIKAIVAARAAGIRTVMITGDHPVTAHAIGQELGVVLLGEDPAGAIHARATPEDKLNIVRQWKSRGAVVAMTGDGVNDAPALREAHVGIAMGMAGTEVTREASDVILTDDNFASIIAAVREGRGIFDNLRKTLVYLLAGNAAELFVMFGAALIGLPLPLLPLHLLWINLVTDGLPALALAVDPVHDDVMKRPPLNALEPMLGRKEWVYIVLTGLLQAALTLGVFFWALRTKDLNHARNMAFSVLVFGELLRAFSARSSDRLLWEVGLFTNLRLLAVVALSVLGQIALHHFAATQRLFHLMPLTLADCVFGLLLGLIPLSVLETTKLVWRARR